MNLMAGVLKMTKINEITAKPFEHFYNMTATPSYSDVIGDIDAESLDNMFNALYGERIVFANFIKDSALNETILNVLWWEFAGKWQKIRDYLNLDYSPISIDTETETYQRDYSSDDTNSITDTNNNNVYGFDSTSAVGDTSSDGKTDSNGTRKDTETYTRTKTGNSSNDPAELIESALRLREHRFIDILLKDMGGALTLNVYD